jgi:xylulokinase
MKGTSMINDGYLLGLDIGSSSIKAALLDIATGQSAASATSPATEMQIIAEKTGWAEQHPESWWENVVAAIAMLRAQSGVDLRAVRAIGISYQMHGLVMVDRKYQAIAPSIIWCDSRAVSIGEKAMKEIGKERCLSRLLNSPGNFTASKLKWVKDNRPDLYKRIFRIMLPGDFIAMKLTGEIVTTASGLSEGIMWDFESHDLATFVLDHFGISEEFIPRRVPTFSVQGNVTAAAAAELGFKKGTPISYRAGDQPNNALSLNVFEPGEIAATAGTSGVVYGVSGSPKYDPACRVNTFAHVNYSGSTPRYGVLLCINGTGILNRWLRETLGSGLSYHAMNDEAQSAPPGCDGLMVMPYGNGAERTLENKNLHASVLGLDFSRHTRAHLLRAAQEGIVFALRYGIDIMRTTGVEPRVVRAGEANMFLSPLFAQAFATVAGAEVELCNTDGSQGAARGAGIGADIYSGPKEAFSSLRIVRTIKPDSRSADAYASAYNSWKAAVELQLSSATR